MFATMVVKVPKDQSSFAPTEHFSVKSFSLAIIGTTLTVVKLNTITN